MDIQIVRNKNSLSANEIDANSSKLTTHSYRSYYVNEQF